MADPTLCRTGCDSDSCRQGRLPCPHRAADVAAMREMGIDLQPLHSRSEDPGPGWWQWMQRHRALIAAALVAACWGVSSVLPMGWAS